MGAIRNEKKAALLHGSRKLSDAVACSYGGEGKETILGAPVRF